MCARVHLHKDSPIDLYHTLIWLTALALNHSVSVETAAMAHESDVTRVHPLPSSDRQETYQPHLSQLKLVLSRHNLH